MKISAAAATHVGRKREENEDSYLVDESLGLYVVCDGMGGHAAGEIASQRSIEFVTDYLREHRSVLQSPVRNPSGYVPVVELVEKAVQHASHRLYELACSHAQHRGMGTTMTLLLIVDSKGIMGHVGDSRLYVVRGDDAHQLSTDHTLANELFMSGGLTAEEAAKSHFNHVLTRVIGNQQSVQVETLLFDLFDEDVLLLCSDGLSNYFVRPQQIKSMLVPDDAESSATSLVRFANAQGGSDNITTIVVNANKEEQLPASEQVRLLEAVKASLLGQQLSESRAIRLLNVASVVQCPTGQTIATAGQPGSGFYVVVEGQLLNESPTGKTGDLKRGDSFGLACLVGDGRSHCSVRATQDSTLLCIPRREFTHLTRRRPRLGRQLFKNIADELCRNLS